MRWVATTIERVAPCSCGTHPVLVLSEIAGAGSLSVHLRADEADRLEREMSDDAAPPESPGGVLEQAVTSTGWTIAAVRLSKGDGQDLVGLVTLASDGDRASVELGAADAVGLAWRRRLPLEVPRDLLPFGTTPSLDRATYW